MLYKQIGGEHLAGIEDLAGRAVERIYTMAKILSAIHKVRTSFVRLSFVDP